MTDRPDGEELLKLSRKGDEEAFVILYRRHQGLVFRFALHMCGRRETAEEIVQEVFLALLSDPLSYIAERGRLEGYLIGITRNLVRVRLRTERRFVSQDDEYRIENELLEGVSRDRDLAELHSAIASLPGNYREVIALCDLENMDYAQVARHLDCPVGTVRSRLHRARAILCAKMRRKERSPA